MRGETLEVQKESFWKEHQDILVQLRHDLVSHRAGRSKFSPVTSARNVTSGVVVSGKRSQHPPYGKYRMTPSPYLPKLNSPVNKDHHLSSPKRFETLPPLKPKLAFSKPAEDYDSWGEVSDDEVEDYVDDSSQRAVTLYTKRQTRTGGQHKQHKLQPYPRVTAGKFASAVPIYYPPLPKIHSNRRQPNTRKRPDRNHFTKGQQKQRPQPTSRAGGHVPNRGKKIWPPQQALPVSTTQPKMSAEAPVFSSTSETEEDESESAKAALLYWQQHPLFADDFTDWFIQDCLHTELCPDLMVHAFKEMKHMPYDHPLYMPSLNCCDDIITDHVSQMIMDVARETITEVAYDYMDERMLQRDPLEDFLHSLVEDVVTMETREIVRSAVVELAEEYLQTQYTTGILYKLVDDYMGEMGPELLEDILFDLATEEFIRSEVIAPEVLEEAEVVARETVHYYDTKVMRREFQGVRQLADNKLADVVMMELVLSVMSQQGNLWTEEEHLSRYLDGVIFNETVSQMISVNKERDRTMHCKPLHKLHEKAVSDVALDVFLEQLTWSLDEDLADIDEYERGVSQEALYPLSLIVR